MKTQLFAIGVLAMGMPLGFADQKEPEKPASTPGKKQNPPKSRPAPATKASDKPKTAPQVQASGVTLVVEFIELEQSNLTELCLNYDFDSDATNLRVALQEMIDEDDATVAATAIVHTRSGQRAKTEAIEEFIYTNEIEESHPTGFETRNVGLTLEVDPVVSNDGKEIDVNLVPELTQHLDEVELGPTASGVPIKAPRFHTAKITTSVTVSNGRYALLGSTKLAEPANPYFEDPIVLVLLRASAH